MFGRIQNIDNRVLDSVGRLHRPKLNKIMIIFSKLGTFGTVWWITCIPFFIMPAFRLTGFNIVFGLCMAHLMGEIIIKHIVRRVRPCHFLDDDDLLVDRPRYYSFPSGHTTASFSVVGVVLLRCGNSIFLLILFMALMIAFSRVYLRVHYLSDVVCGTALGLICGICSVVIFNSLIMPSF